MIAPEFGPFSNDVAQMLPAADILTTYELVAPIDIDGIIPVVYECDFEIWPGQSSFLAAPDLIDKLASGRGSYGYMLFNKGMALLKDLDLSTHYGIRPTLDAFSDMDPLEVLANIFLQGIVAEGISNSQTTATRKIAGNFLHTLAVGPTGLLARTIYGDIGVERLFAEVDPMDHFALGVNFINQLTSNRTDVISDANLREIMLYRYGFVTGTPVQNADAGRKIGLLSGWSGTYAEEQIISGAIKHSLATFQDGDAVENSRKTIAIVDTITRSGVLPEQLPIIRAKSMAEAIDGYTLPQAESYGHSAWQMQNELAQLITKMQGSEVKAMGFGRKKIKQIVSTFQRAAVLADPFPPALRAGKDGVSGGIYDELQTNYESATRQQLLRNAVLATNELITSRGNGDECQVPHPPNPHAEGLPSTLVHHIIDNLHEGTLADVANNAADIANIIAELSVLRREPHYQVEASNLLNSIESLYAHMLDIYRQLIDYYISVDADVDTISCTINVSGNGDFTQLEDAEVVMIGKVPIVTVSGSAEFMLLPDRIYYFDGTGCIPASNNIVRIASGGNGYTPTKYNITGIQPNARNRRSLKSTRQL